MCPFPERHPNFSTTPFQAVNRPDNVGASFTSGNMTRSGKEPTDGSGFKSQTHHALPLQLTLV